MDRNKFSQVLNAILATAAMMMILGIGALAQECHDRVLYTFKGGVDGEFPFAGLILDAAGNLFGTTQYGGAHNAGTVFKLTRHSNGPWTKQELYSFTGGADGSGPAAGLIFDAVGNLFGTTAGGGDSGLGVVFKISPTGHGTWTEDVLYSFAEEGESAASGLVFDTAGNLYGTNPDGGTYRFGEVFKLTPNKNGPWTKQTLHSFTGGADGMDPAASLIIDAAGNLYGTTQWDGDSGSGVIFKLAPNTDGTWTVHVLHEFKGGSDGRWPASSLAFDKAGNLYGTTYRGGVGSCPDGEGCGVLFKLTHTASGGWIEKVLWSFLDRPGAFPVAGVIFDETGNLYGTTMGDLGATHGSVFEFVK